MTIPGLGGAPRKFNTVEELQILIEEYFNYIDEYNRNKPDNEKPRPYTVTGLCVYLDIVRDTLIEYGKKSEFTDTIKKAKQRIESSVEEGSLNGKWNTIGSIFNLKNNFGWVDKIDIATNNQPEQLSPDDLKKQLEARKKAEKTEED